MLVRFLVTKMQFVQKTLKWLLCSVPQKKQSSKHFKNMHNFVFPISKHHGWFVKWKKCKVGLNFNSYILAWVQPFSCMFSSMHMGTVQTDKTRSLPNCISTQLPVHKLYVSNNWLYRFLFDSFVLSIFISCLRRATLAHRHLSKNGANQKLSIHIRVFLFFNVFYCSLVKLKMFPVFTT